MQKRIPAYPDAKTGLRFGLSSLRAAGPVPAQAYPLPWGHVSSYVSLRDGRDRRSYHVISSISAGLIAILYAQDRVVQGPGKKMRL